MTLDAGLPPQEPQMNALPSSPAGRVLALIVARGGSKGLPRKNVKIAGGRPLIAWTIEAALAARAVGSVVLSSDDEEIMAVARDWGCEVPFVRPSELATDQATSMDVVRHALSLLPAYEFVMLLQPTSPMRTGADIDAAFELMLARNAPSCVSVTEVEQSPYWMYRVEPDDRLASLLPPPPRASRRQDLPVVHTLNGAIYLARVDWLLAQGGFVNEGTVGYQMPRERSIDIDTADDFEAFCRRVDGSNARHAPTIKPSGQPTTN